MDLILLTSKVDYLHLLPLNHNLFCECKIYCKLALILQN